MFKWKIVMSVEGNFSFSNHIRIDVIIFPRNEMTMYTINNRYRNTIHKLWKLQQESSLKNILNLAARRKKRI